MVITNEKTRLVSVGVLILISLSLISALCFREPWLWMDEVLSYVLISDPSPTHLNSAVVSNMDANPPLFPNLYWLIGHLISLNTIFLRAVSAVLFVGTMGLFCWYTTRLTGNLVTNFVLLSVMAYFTHQNFAHATEIRSYALLLPISFAYFVVSHRLISSPANGRLLFAHTLTGMLMAYCHNYGLFYLAASGLFFGALWLWSRRADYVRVLVSFGLIGLTWLLTWYSSFIVQARAGQPHSWIPRPTVHSVFEAIGDLIPSPFPRLEWDLRYEWLLMLRVVLTVSLFAYILSTRYPLSFQRFRSDKAFQFFVMAGFIWLTTALIALTISLTYTSIFISRYMWPSHLLVLYILIYSINQLVDSRPFVPVLLRAMPVYVLLLVSGIFYKVWKIRSPFRSQILTYLPQLDTRYPVFVERADYFLPLWFHNHHSKVAFLLDWDVANQPGNIRSATTDYKILKSLREKYHVSSIVPVDRFNAANFGSFYVVDEDDVYQMEHFIETGQINVIRQLPINMAGHRILECKFSGRQNSELSVRVGHQSASDAQQTN